MIVIIKLHFRVIFWNTFSLNKKVSIILAMIVIIKLHIRVIFRNTFSPNTKQEVIKYPCNDCDWWLSSFILGSSSGSALTMTVTMSVSHGGWLWTIGTWVLRLFWVVAWYLHWLQGYRTPSWIDSTCNFRLPFVVALYWQSSCLLVTKVESY